MEPNSSQKFNMIANFLYCSSVDVCSILLACIGSVIEMFY